MVCASIAFTERLAALLGVDRSGLKIRIDQLFLACLERLVESKPKSPEAEAIVAAVAEAGDELGVPAGIVEEATHAAKSEDFIPYAELLAEVAELLVSRAGMDNASAAGLHNIVDRAQFHLTFGSNRQNVLGEGFEDLLRLLALRVAGVPVEKICSARKRTNCRDSKESWASPGASNRRTWRSWTAGTALLLTVKWSLRHDRQKQLSDELDCYVQLLSQDGFPEYVLVTNEYDPGRLKNSSHLSSRGKTVDVIYHINPALLVEVLSDVPSSAAEVQELIDTGRLRSLEAFLTDLRRWRDVP